MNKYSIQAEILILQGLVAAKEKIELFNKRLSLLDIQWFTAPHQEILKVFFEKKTPISVLQLMHLAYKSKISLTADYIKNLFENINYRRVDEEYLEAVNIVKRKYQQRQLEAKLMEIHSNIYDKSLEETKMELLQQLSVIKSELKHKNLLDELGLENEDLIKFSDTRPALNELAPLRKTLMVIGGDSGHHKTNQVLDILLRALEANRDDPKFKVGFFSAEMSFDRIRERILSRILHIPLINLKRRKVDLDEIRSKMKNEYSELLDRFIIIPPADFKTTSDISALVSSYNLSVWGLDFLQYFAYLGNKKNSQNENVMEAISNIKAIAHLTNSLGIIISQVRKKSESRIRQFPMIDDLEWSGMIKQIADIIGMCFWAIKIKSWYGGITNKKPVNKEVYIVSWQKNRDGADFNEVLRVIPEFCTFETFPIPPVNVRDYLEF